MADRTPEQIEREIEAERGALARSLDALQNQFSPEAMVDTATTYLRQNGSDWARSATRQARDNPIALAVTGVGLAWLIAGPARKHARAGTYDRWKATHDVDSFRENYGRPREDEIEVGHRDVGHEERPHALGTSGVPAPRPRIGYDDRDYAPVAGFRSGGRRMEGFDDRLARASARRREPEGPGIVERLSHGAEDVKERVRHAFDAIRERFGSSAPAWARSSDDWMTGTTSKEHGDSLRDRLKEGTEKMTDAARDRVIAAREAALDAQHYLADRTRDYASSGREYYSDQPLIGGLLAFGLGALIGAALPRTRYEDEYVGAYRDRALEEAERIYHEESERLKAVADAALNEAKSVATETLDQVKSGAPSGKEAVDKAEGAAKSAAQRVADAAKAEADKQNLGGSVR